MLYYIDLLSSWIRMKYLDKAYIAMKKVPYDVIQK